MKWELDYREFQALYCTCKAHDKAEEENKCDYGLKHKLDEMGDDYLVSLLEDQDVLNKIAEIANAHGGGGRIEVSKWENLPVLIRNFEGVEIPTGKTWDRGRTEPISEEDIIITPTCVYIPWPLPFEDSTLRRELADDYKHVTDVHLKPLPKLYDPAVGATDDNLDKEYLLYWSQMSHILRVSHPTIYCLSDEQLKRYITDTKGYLQDTFEYPLPQYMKVETLRDTWDCTIACYEELQDGTHWTMKVRGMNASPSYDLLMLVKIPELYQRLGLNVENLIRFEDEQTMLIMIPDEWRHGKYKVTIKELVYKKEDLGAALCEGEDTPMATASDSSLLCWGQCPD